MKNNVVKITTNRRGYCERYRFDSDADRVFMGSKNIPPRVCKKLAGTYALAYPTGMRRYIVAAAVLPEPIDPNELDFLVPSDSDSAAFSTPDRDGATVRTDRQRLDCDFLNGKYFCTKCGQIFSTPEAAARHKCVKISASTRVCALCGSVLADNNKNRLCPDCQRDCNAKIYGYHDRPNRSRVLFSNPDKRAKYVHIGAEIETNAAAGICAKTLASRADSIFNADPYAPVIAFEHDGSLGENGVEMITQPLTYRRFKAMYNNINDLYTAPERAHTSEACGLHFHIDREFFEGADMAAAIKIDFMINAYFREFWNAASGRAHESHYAGKKDMPEKKTPLTVTAASIRNTDRYFAVNVGSRQTIELRLFGGGGMDSATAFFAALDLAQAVARWAKRVGDTAFTRATPLDLIPFLRDRMTVATYLATREKTRMVKDFLIKLTEVE